MNLDEAWSKLRDYAHEGIKKLEKKDITHAEAFFTSIQRTEVTVRNSEILTQNRVFDSGVGFRIVVSGNKVGFACTNSLSEKTVLEAGEKALAIARASSEVTNFALPEESRINKVNGLFDPRVAETTVEDAVGIANRAINAAEGFDKRVIAKDGRVLYMSGFRGIINTLGVDCEEKETKSLIYLGGSGKQNSELTGSCYDFMFKRSADLDPETVGKNVGRKVIALFKPKAIASLQGTVVFGPEAVSNQFCDVLIETVKGESVVAGRSAWNGKIGQTITSENLTITDDATFKNGFSSRSFDDEGYPSQNTVLLRKGKLESFLHHATTAKALKTKNTGNASRYPGGFDMTRMIAGEGYRAKPEVYPSNLIIQTGNKSRSQLISEVDKGVLVESMAGFAQKGSGLISAQLSQAFFIRNGEIKHAIKGGMVSGVASDWFKQVSEIGKDSVQFQNAVVPSVCVENVKVIGSSH